MTVESTTTPRFHRLSVITLVVGAMLIWVGAAVTTTGSGMAFSDWPLSNGSVNPAGWLHIEPQLLEHGHRLLASTVGFLVLGLFLWQWRIAALPMRMPSLLIGTFLLLFISVHAADGMAKESETGIVRLARSVGLNETALWVISVLLIFFTIGWLVEGLASSRWSRLLKLSAAALVVVVAQAVLGGLRVLEVSDPFGVAHGCLGQLAFCLFLTIALFSSETWQSLNIIAPISRRRRLVTLSTILFSATSLQLLFGAIIRHTQRAGLVATDLFTTAGHFVPPFVPANVFSIFLHKSWGVIVFSLAMFTSAATQKPWRGQHRIIVLSRLLIVLPILQVSLGAFVLFSKRSFWVTNFHVLNGLFILATAYTVMLIAWRGRPVALAHARHDAQTEAA